MEKVKRIYHRVKKKILYLLIGGTALAAGTSLIPSAQLNTDYKFWYIKRCDNVHICEAAIRFYEGSVTTKQEVVDRVPIPVKKYRRSKRLSKTELNYLSTINFKKESSGKDVAIYTTKDFGLISTDDELREFLNKELNKDKSRSSINEQALK